VDIDNAFVTVRGTEQINQTKQIIKPGTRSPVIFTPIRISPRCQDPDRLFISDQNKNRIHAHRRPRCHIKTLCFTAWRFLLCRSKALRRFLSDFNTRTYPNITDSKITSQSESGRIMAICCRHWPTGSRGSENPDPRKARRGIVAIVAGIVGKVCNSR
jgi:hypothetical protein